MAQMPLFSQFAMRGYRALTCTSETPLTIPERGRREQLTQAAGSFERPARNS
jgi:hypothetical protein